jgi:hypothetical protein
VFSVASVYAAYRLGNDFYTANTGLYGAAFLAVTETLIHYGQEARPYSLLILLTIISTYTYLRFLEDQTSSLLAYTAINTAMLYTHIFGALIVASHAIHYLIKRGLRKTTERTELLASYAVTGLLFTPWLPTLLSQISDASLNWITPLTLDQAYHTYFLLFTSPIILVIFLLLLVWQRPKDVSMLYAWAAIPPIAAAAYSLLLQPAFIHRYLLITAPALYLLHAHSLDSINNDHVKHVFGAALLIVLSLSSYYPDNFHRDDWNDVNSFLRDNPSPRAVLLHPHFEQSPFTYQQNPECFPIDKMKRCNADHGIYSADPSTCCQDNTSLLATNRTLGQLASKPIRVIHFKTGHDAPLLSYLNNTGGLHQEKALNARRDLPLLPAYHHPKLTIHTYTPN